MRPITCKGGYALPVKQGMCEIVGICAPVSSTSAASRLTLQDNDPYADFGNAMPAEDVNLKNVIFDFKGIANYDGNTMQLLKEPIKAVKGVCLVNGTNLSAGRIIVYIK